jgi:selenocysteine lyase/cysteine desulfurase
MSLENFKSSFARTGRANLNNAGIGSMCQPAIDAAAQSAQAMSEGGASFPPLWERYQAARASLAKLVGATPENLAHMQTCAIAISTVALGMPMGAGEDVIITDQEYPSNAYPWYRAAERAGARVVQVPSDDWEIDTGRIIEAITPRTRVVAVSWVQYQTGAMVDLKALSAACRENDAWLVVDAIQGVGVLPFDLEELGVDVVCGGTHKWITGPMGHGYIAFREGRMADVEPLYYGAMSYGTPDDRPDPRATLREDAKRYEPGNPLFLGGIAGGAAADLILETGVDVVAAEAARLAKRLRDGIAAAGGTVLGPDHQSPIVTFRMDGQEGIMARLDEDDIAWYPRAGGIRLAPHAYNTDEEIDRALAAVTG